MSHIGGNCKNQHYCFFYVIIYTSKTTEILDKFSPLNSTGLLFCGSIHFPSYFFIFFLFSDVKTLFLHRPFGECLPVVVFCPFVFSVCVDACARLHTTSLIVHFDLRKPVLYISCLHITFTFETMLSLPCHHP